MNNYSWWQKKLHEIALSTSFMREATFDFESPLIAVNQTNDNHVFVSGLARSVRRGPLARPFFGRAGGHRVITSDAQLAMKGWSSGDEGMVKWR